MSHGVLHMTLRQTERVQNGSVMSPPAKKTEDSEVEGEDDVGPFFRL